MIIKQLLNLLIIILVSCKVTETSFFVGGTYRSLAIYHSVVLLLPIKFSVSMVWMNVFVSIHMYIWLFMPFEFRCLCKYADSRRDVVPRLGTFHSIYILNSLVTSIREKMFHFDFYIYLLLCYYYLLFNISVSNTTTLTY